MLTSLICTRILLVDADVEVMVITVSTHAVDQLILGLNNVSSDTELAYIHPDMCDLQLS